MARTNAVTKTEQLKIVVDASAKVLHTFALGRDLGVASVSEYGGKRALDIRRFYFGEDDAWHPTAKGIRIPVESAHAVIHALIDHLNAGDVK